MEGSLVRIVCPLLDVGGEVRIGGVDREVVADGAEAAKRRLQHGLAVDGVFQRQAQVVVVERRGVDEHRQRVVAAAR